MELLKDLNWRYATKNMNGEAIPKEALDTILEAIRLTATSYGLQPFKVIVVKDSETKQKLMAASYGQAQVGSASEVLVFAVPDKVTQADVDSYMQLTADTRSIPLML